MLKILISLTIVANIFILKIKMCQIIYDLTYDLNLLGSKASSKCGLTYFLFLNVYV